MADEQTRGMRMEGETRKMQEEEEERAHKERAAIDMATLPSTGIVTPGSHAQKISSEERRARESRFFRLLNSYSTPVLF